MNTLDGTGQKNNFTQTYEAYVNDIYRLCFSFMKNHMDAEDIVHETFLKYYHLDRTFDSEQHKKAWLIVTASNACKDMLKHLSEMPATLLINYGNHWKHSSRNSLAGKKPLKTINQTMAST